MTATAPTRYPNGLPHPALPLKAWWPLAIGLLALLVPTWVRLGGGIWQDSEYSHGPVVLALAAYLAWIRRDAFLAARTPPSAWPGYVLVLVGALCAGPAVWIKSSIVEAFAHALIIMGALWLVGGARLLRRMSLPLVVFMLAAPLPGHVLAAMTGSLKSWVSMVAEWVLYEVGYPIARQGVTLSIGQYRLLVADACSGMNSLMSLVATGIFYIDVSGPRANWQTALLGAAILPLAVLANIVRVIVLMLVTFHLGDAAGQGFLHELSGFVMFLLAVAALFAIDRLLRRFRGARPSTDAALG
jgi:exosortase